MLDGFEKWVSENAERIVQMTNDKAQISNQVKNSNPRNIDNLKLKIKNSSNFSGKKIGRNDPCPCGSGKKYKKCCGK
jgi:uncharacterized protein YecA (UPF0149 family)